MELYLESGLEHQELPVESIADIFEGVPTKDDERQLRQNPIFDYTEGRQQLISNIKKAQRIEKAHGGEYQKVPFSNDRQTLNLDVKMETGTGKTYVYTHTMYELHKRYGVNKFIVVVPTHPIKTGAETFLSDPAVMHHFSDTGGYESVKIDLCVINAMKGKKKGKQLKSDALRPIASVRRPPRSAPATHPHTHALATAPWRNPERPNIRWICCSQPLMTAVS